MNNLTYKEAYIKAGALCARAEKAPIEIEQKAVRDWGLEREEAQRLVEELKHEGFINEERYARAFVNDKFKFAHWGKTKIAAALRQKGIDSEMINNALAEVVDEEAELQALKQILIRHAMSKGYSYETVSKLFK